MTPDEYCQQKAARSGSSFYYSFLFLPTEQRQAIIALYAFCREVDDTVDETSESEVARTKLAWWRQELGRVFSGEAQHPVGKALQIATHRYNLPEEYFIEIVDGMEMDLDYDSYPSFKELSLYCHRVASMVGLMAAEIFGYQDRQTLKYAHDLGMAMQLTNIIRDVREDAARGRIYLPLDELKAQGIDPGDIFSFRQSEALSTLLHDQAVRARDYYQRALDRLPEVDRYQQRSGLIMADIYQKNLDMIEEDGFRVMEHRIAMTPLRKLWRAWRINRQEKALHARKRGIGKD